MLESKSVTKDPICGMTVDEATALHVERDGQPFYFCSETLPEDLSLNDRHCETRRDAAGQNHLHVSDAPGSAAGPSRPLPQVRHGAGTAGGLTFNDGSSSICFALYEESDPLRPTANRAKGLSA